MATGEADDLDALKTCLMLLEDEVDADQLRSCLETLLKIHQNILQHPLEEKYQKLKKENKMVRDKVWQHEGAREFLHASGWTEVDELLMYVEQSDATVDKVIQVIEEKLHALPPSVNSKSSPNSHPVPFENSVWTEAEMKQKEDVINKARERQIQQYKRMKQEREAIKRQIKDDRTDSNTREVKESHATQMNYDTTFKKFENPA